MLKRKRDLGAFVWKNAQPSSVIPGVPNPNSGYIASKTPRTILGRPVYNPNPSGKYIPPPVRNPNPSGKFMPPPVHNPGRPYAAGGSPAIIPGLPNPSGDFINDGPPAIIPGVPSPNRGWISSGPPRVIPGVPSQNARYKKRPRPLPVIRRETINFFGEIGDPVQLNQPDEYAPALVSDQIILKRGGTFYVQQGYDETDSAAISAVSALAGTATSVGTAVTFTNAQTLAVGQHIGSAAAGYQIITVVTDSQHVTTAAAFSPALAGATINASAVATTLLTVTVPQGSDQSLLITHFANELSDIAAWGLFTWNMYIDGVPVKSYFGVKSQLGQANLMRRVGVDILVNGGQTLRVDTISEATVAYNSLVSLIGAYGNYDYQKG